MERIIVLVSRVVVRLNGLLDVRQLEKCPEEWTQLGRISSCLPYTDFCLGIGGDFLLGNEKARLENGLVVCNRNL